MKHIWHLRPHKTGYLLDIGRTQFPCLVGKSGLVAVDEKKREMALHQRDAGRCGVCITALTE